MAWHTVTDVAIAASIGPCADALRSGVGIIAGGVAHDRRREVVA